MKQKTKDVLISWITLILFIISMILMVVLIIDKSHPDFKINLEQVEVDVIEYCPKIFEEGGGCICGDFKKSKEDLDIKWLNENAECIGGCELTCLNEYEERKNIRMLNKCIQSCPNTRIPVCSKYKYEDYTIDVIR